MMGNLGLIFAILNSETLDDQMGGHHTVDNAEHLAHDGRAD